MFYDSSHSGAECLNVKLGTSVKFTLHAKLKSCRPETFVVTPVGIKDKMVVEVEPLCECPCAQEGDGADLEERWARISHYRLVESKKSGNRNRLRIDSL